MKSFIRIPILLLLLTVLIGMPETTFAQVHKWVKIGSLYDWFADEGCEIEEGDIKNQQQRGLSWPSQYQKQDCQAAKALWIGTTDYTDAEQYGGMNLPVKMVCIGPRHHDLIKEFMPMEIKMYGKFNRPDVYVDNIPSSELMFTEEDVEINPDLLSDRYIYNVVNTSIGITMTRNIYAWSQQYHDNYFIYEYVFKNTGNCDKDEEIEKPGQVLTNVIFLFQYRYAVAYDGCLVSGFDPPRWGKNEMLSTRGEAKESMSTDQIKYKGDYEDYLNGDPDADSMRCQFAWKGPYSAAAYDYIGIPDVRYGTGRFMGPQFVGNITLHADKSASDTSDDPQQPTTTTYIDSNHPSTYAKNQFNITDMLSDWALFTRGHRLPRHDEAVGDGYPDNFEGTAAGNSNVNGYGPYTMNFGDSIRIVMAEGVDGLSRKMCEDLGKEWIKAYLNSSYNGPFVLPEGGTTTDKDEYKNAWVFTGEDSLMRTLGRARRNYKLNFDIPQPPPPPAYFGINSGGDRINLSWTNEAELDPNFAGYKVYRAIGKYDTTFDLIFSCGKGTANEQIVNSYQDMSAARGQSYYYYISSFNDGSNNTPGMYPPETTPNPHGILESGMFWTRTTQPAYLRRAPGNDLSKIRVVPNPYNIRSSNLQYIGQPDKIMFLNIPGECTIKIFTERGDLIKTIDHMNGSGDESWNSNTDYGQVVVSGVYIVHFQVDKDLYDAETGELLFKKGASTFRKFVVIR